MIKKKKFNPKVSIIIPVYNGSDYLHEAIESALSQSYKNTEVIVVNDGSTDGGKTDKIAKSFGKKIRYFSKENGGVATALNLGIEKMKGEYFSWLSHDDVYYPNKIEKQIQYIVQHDLNNIILYSDFEIINEKSEKTSEYRIPSFHEDKFIFELIQETFVHGCTLLIPRKCFAKVGLFNEKLLTNQDYEMWVKLAKIYRFLHLPDVLIKYRVHPNQGCINIPAHNDEACNFYLWYIQELPINSIMPLYGISIAQFYYKIALRFLQRRLIPPYNKAIQLALQFSLKENFFCYLKLKLCSVSISLIEFLKTIKRLTNLIKKVRFNISGGIK